MIDSFTGEYRFLSNFHPCEVWFEGQKFPSVEHAYVAAKTLDLNVRSEVATISTPGQVKRFGRTLKLRPDWDSIKLAVMFGLLRQKFNHDELAMQLVATDDQELVEGNTWGDIFWGEYLGSGENWLGRMLMLIRSDLCYANHIY